MNYATATNLRGESLAECTERLRKDHGLFAEGYALTCWRYFQGSHQYELAVFYKMVAHFIDIGVELDQQRLTRAHQAAATHGLHRRSDDRDP